MIPEERMQTVAGLDNGIQSRFEVGAEGRQWLQNDLAAVDKTTPIVIFSHSPLYKYYRNWNFWTDDADEVQAILSKFDTVSVIHGHTHQLLLNHIGNINFYGLLSTAWPWPYAPEGLPKLTVQMNRSDPFNAFDGCGDGLINVLASGMVDKVYNLWNRNPVTVRASYLSSNGAKDRPAGDDAFQLLREDHAPSHALALAFSLAAGPALAGSDMPRHQLPPSPDGNLVVGLCDGETSIEVKGVKPGDPLTREQGQQIADTLMKEWRSKHPDAEWVVAAADSPLQLKSEALEFWRRWPVPNLWRLYRARPTNLERLDRSSGGGRQTHFS